MTATAKPVVGAAGAWAGQEAHWYSSACHRRGPVTAACLAGPEIGATGELHVNTIFTLDGGSYSKSGEIPTPRRFLPIPAAHLP